jgi:TPR repeat protein
MKVSSRERIGKAQLDNASQTPKWVGSMPVTAFVRFFRPVLLVVLSVMPAIAAPADQAFRQGLSAYHSGDYQKAMKIWLPLAQKEDAAAQAGIGFMYHRGMGVVIDNDKAAYWLRKAAEHGQPEGQFMLGSLYFYGAGVEKSYVQAYAWCDLAQDGGNADAQSCRDAALQSLKSKDDVKTAFRLSVDLHQRFARAHGK